VVFFLPTLTPIISPLHFTPILSHYKHFLALWYTYISPNYFNALKTPNLTPHFFIGGKLHPIGGKKRPIFSVSLRHPPPTKIWWVIRQDADTARNGHAQFTSWRNGKTIWNCHIFVVPLYCWGNGKTRTRQPTTAKQWHWHGHGKSVSLRHHGTARQEKTHGKASQFTTWKCTTYNLELSYLCSTFVSL